MEKKRQTTGRRQLDKKKSRKKSRGNSGRTPILVVILLIFLVIVAGIGSSVISRFIPSKKMADLYDYYRQPASSEAVLIVNHEILEQRGLAEGGQVYLPLDMVNTYLNQRYYYDKETDMILYTTPSEILEYGVIGNSDVKVREEGLYLSIDFVKEHTDFDAYVGENPMRVSINNQFESLNMIPVKQDTKIRVLGGIKSDILTTVAAGDQLFLLDELENWDHVATKDGYIGYTEKKNLGKAELVSEQRDFAEEEYNYLTLDGKVNLVWHQVTNSVANEMLTNDIANVTGVNVISPTWFALKDNQGNLFNIASYDYVEEAHSRGMQVWGLVDNFTFDADIVTYEILSTRSARRNAISQLIDAALEVGLDGINVDFEMLSEECGIHFLEFLRELSVSCHKYNLILSVDNPVPEDFTSHYDRAEQGRIVDYVIVMGYDEHYVGSEIEGSVASLPWVEKGIQDTIDQVPAERVINGMPFYMRLWKRSAGILSSEAIGMNQAQETLRANNVDTYWNTDVEQYYGEYEVGGDLYQIWVEDPQSIASKVKLVPKYNLAGVAAWKLGFENSEVWNVITANLN